uniref:Cytochrome b n=1 Tax=Brentisentis yangtzensis TaxID=2604967 RepID=A0A5B9RFX8_9BILA|nr:cytochrome b [Brentisentis yangtzensis]
MLLDLFKTMIKGFLLDLPTPLNINFWYGLGSMLGLVYCIQIISGLILSWFYHVGSEGGFMSVVWIMQDIYGGWLIRFTHSSGVSIFLFLMYLHIMRGLMYGSFKKVGVWVSGVCILLLSMGAAFLGYVLPWGSMSYWGMTVVTSMLSAVPMIGGFLVETVWGGSSASVDTLVRFFSFHYILSLVVMVLVVIHLVMLHEEGSSNPLGLMGSSEKVVFHGLMSYKDVLGFMGVFILYWIAVFVAPYMLLDPANFLEVDFLVTPTHIKPEWYFLFVYCILRSTPNKLGGVILMVLAIVMLVFLSGGSSAGVVRYIGGVYWKWLMVMFVSSFYILTVLGGCVVEAPFEMLGILMSIIYFMLFIVMLAYKYITDLVGVNIVV